MPHADDIIGHTQACCRARSAWQSAISHLGTQARVLKAFAAATTRLLCLYNCIQTAISTLHPSIAITITITNPFANSNIDHTYATYWTIVYELRAPSTSSINIFHRPSPVAQPKTLQCLSPQGLNPPSILGLRIQDESMLTYASDICKIVCYAFSGYKMPLKL